MVLVTGRHLEAITREFPDAAAEILAWANVVRAARWRSLVEVRTMYRDADWVRGYVVFNIRHNRYRLITVIHFSKEKEGKRTQGHVYIRSLLTHKEYDDPKNWDKEFGS